MAIELVHSATSEKLKEMDWTKNIEICELVAHDQGQAKDVIKAIKKRLGSKSSNTQLFAVLLLEMLIHNCGEHIHKQVIDTGILPILVKIVKKKSDVPAREKIFLLLDATQTSLGGASGKFPQYYAAYYELVNAGVKFSQAPKVPPHIPISPKDKVNSPGAQPSPPKPEEVAQQPKTQIVPESSIIEKAVTSIEVLREVLDAIDTQNPEAAKDEFTLDLVEQCSFQKQRLMHLVMTSRNEKTVSKAIDLNEQLQKVLNRHDALLSVQNPSTARSFSYEEVENEEEAELIRRIRKGKACARAEDEEHHLYRQLQEERRHLPLIRPLSLEPRQTTTLPPPVVIIPPPPAKRVEREKFFQENHVDGAPLEGSMRSLSLHSRNASSSRSESIDSSE